jgi:O-acetyl-ADP-ribose deacetylase
MVRSIAPVAHRITSGGRLRAKHVIHAVGPVYQDGKHREPELLAGAYQNSLELASRHGVKTVAFPSISTGAYGYPLESAANVALTTVRDYLKNHPEIKTVSFVLFGEKAYKAYEDALKELTTA